MTSSPKGEGRRGYQLMVIDDEERGDLAIDDVTNNSRSFGTFSVLPILFLKIYIVRRFISK